MDKSYAFFGTSYLCQCEPEYVQDDYLIDKTNWRHVCYQTSIIRELSKRHPNNTFYNCSEDGQGIDQYPKRVLECLDRYNPDVFVFEIPCGERYTLYTNNDYYQNYDLFFPVIEYKAGIPHNLKERSSPIRPAVLDSFQATLSNQDLNEWWHRHTGDTWELSEKQWRGYKQVLTHTNNGVLSRHSDVMAQAQLITSHLESKGKEVYWFYWITLNHYDTLHLKLPMLSDKCILEWEYENHTGKTNTKFDSLNPNDDLEHWSSYWNTLCYDNNFHLHSQYMPRLSQYFDKVFK